MVDLGADAPVDDNEIEPGANLYGVDLPSADLSGADLSDATLSEADLSGADLSGVNLYNADLYKADLPRADLSGVTLSEANLSKIDLSNASLSSANLSNADLSNADLSGADFSDADLSNADLSNADLSGADFSDAYVSNATLSGADLSGSNLSNESSVFQRVTDLIDGGRLEERVGSFSELNTQPETLERGTSQPQTATDEQSGIVLRLTSWLWSDRGIPTHGQSGTVRSRTRATVIALGGLGWVVVWLGVYVIPDTPWLILFFAVWGGLPTALFIDAKALRETGEWPRYWVVYVLTSAIWFFGFIPAAVYLWRR
jgi:hypothetical protein